MKHRITIERIVLTLAGLFVGIWLDFLANLLPNQGPIFQVIFGIITLMTIAGAFYIYLHDPAIVKAIIKKAFVLRTEQEEKENARQGVIAFISLYNPFKSEKADKLTLQQRLDAAQALDYEALDLEHSNLEPVIRAIYTHRAGLKHCWLISTTSVLGGQAGSLPYTGVLIKYLREVKGMQCSFHGGEPYAVSLDDDALVTLRTRDRIDAAFKEAKSLGIETNQVVADFSAGVRSMTLGMILACLDGSRDIQFIGTHYDEAGKPTGGLFPILFDFEPKIEDRS